MESMKKEEEKILEEILEGIEQLTNVIMGEMIEEIPEDHIQAFRITEEVFNELEKELGEDWMNDIGIT
jgi:hypothetical protein